MSEQVEVASLPACNFHPFLDGAKPLADYDGQTVFGTWGFMCEPCFKMYGVGLGTGKGQRLILAKPKVST